MFSEILGNSIRIRRPRVADAERTFQWFSDPEVTRYLPLAGRGNLPMPAILSHLEKVSTSDRPQLAVSIELKDGEHIGTASFRDFIEGESAEFSIVIGEAKARGKGIGRETMRLLLEYAFSELNLKQVWLIVRTDNSAGVRLFQKLGFEVQETLKAAAMIDGQPVDKLKMALSADKWSEGKSSA